MLLNQMIEKWLKDTTQMLNIRNLGLTEWPKQLIGKEYLMKKLNCGDNKLTSLPKDLTNLKTLYCHNNNKLISLPNDFTKLVILNCSRNKLTSLPNNLTKLKILSCWNNKLTSLPNNLTKLEYSDCSDNELTSLPNNLTNLKTLSCSRNKLTSLPNNLTNIKELYCSNNQLTSLPNDLTNLETLYCWNNQLFSNELEKWKKIWPISLRHQHILRNAGLKKVVKILKNRSYLPRLDELHHELIWSPNHPGKFFELLPRCGNWCK